MFRPLYHWTLRLADRPSASAWLAVVSFMESSVFPIPPDILLMPMILANRSRAFRLALICTLASVAGAALGYAIGALFWSLIGQPVIAFYGYEDKFSDFQTLFATYGVLTVLIGGLTPVPYKVVTIASGLFGFSLVIFLVSSLAARGLRFFAEAALLWYFGEPIRDFVERRLNLLATIFMILLVGGFLLLKGLH